ncbi:hypothetical protein IR010_10700 [Flavobacterium sp. MR2016-29]|uniref:hypothetical protein n=1 Tax=Flavobacterium sp. MR2016-29 TaxID=2783795 RepID=UPI00188BB9B0|nr:hypothetical protein [Flavobacterium sp. MR2016-29]MBF4493012.1 hypothetical protein [Flavobacterium sp. MR2016-29]
MIKNLLRILLVLLFSNSIQAQEVEDSAVKEKSNPIVYAEAFGGFAVVHTTGVAGGAELNYQAGKNLFSFRYTNAVGYTKKEETYIIPAFDKTEDNNEFALLFGRRWLKESHSYSISAGINYNSFELIKRDEEGNRYSRNKYFYGVPFEANYKWFYSKRRSNLVFNTMIPSVGIKLFGSIAKNTFVGVGITLGFGLHKEYK